MKIFPFEKYVIETDKGIEEINGLIDRNCEPWKFPLVRQKNPMPLVGCRNGRWFKLYRYIAFGYRNSSRPIAFGKICTQNGSVNIEITMRMHLLTITFTSLVFLFLGISFLAFLSSSKYFATSVTLGIFIFFYLLACYAFWQEENKLKELVLNLFKNG